MRLHLFVAAFVIRLPTTMMAELILGVVRLYATAPLAVFDEPLRIKSGMSNLQQYLRDRDHKRGQAIQKFLKRVKRDPELRGILRFYGATDVQIEKIIALLIECAVPPRTGIAVPFVLEMCAYVLSVSNGKEIDDNTRALISRIYRKPGFLNEAQRERYVEIFGASACVI